MKKYIIILEGISTSGKTSVMSLIDDFCKKNDISVTCFPEESTIIPMIDNTNLSLAIAFINNIIVDITNCDSQLIILDRFYFSHLLKTGGSVKDFLFAEKILKRNTLLVYLYIDKRNISSRIFDAMNYREPGWGEYLLKRVNGDRGKIIKFYNERQKKLKAMMKESILDKMYVDTSDLNFNSVVSTIIDNTIKNNSENH